MPISVHVITCIFVLKIIFSSIIIVSTCCCLVSLTLYPQIYSTQNIFGSSTDRAGKTAVDMTCFGFRTIFFNPHNLVHHKLFVQTMYIKNAFEKSLEKKMLSYLKMCDSYETNILTLICVFCCSFVSFYTVFLVHSNVQLSSILYTPLMTHDDDNIFSCFVCRCFLFICTAFLFISFLLLLDFVYLFISCHFGTQQDETKLFLI